MFKRNYEADAIKALEGVISWSDFWEVADVFDDGTFNMSDIGRVVYLFQIDGDSDPENVHCSEGTSTGGVEVDWDSMSGEGSDPSGIDAIALSGIESSVIESSLTGDEGLLGIEYRVYRATSAAGEKTAVSGWQTGTSFLDTTASPGVVYYYFVKAQYEGYEGLYSAPVSGYRKKLTTRTRTRTFSRSR